MTDRAAALEVEDRSHRHLDEAEDVFVPVNFTPSESTPTLAETLAAGRPGEGLYKVFAGEAADPLRTTVALPAKGALAARTVMLLASVAIHLAATAFFWSREPEVEIAGGDATSITMIGNAFEDATRAGEQNLPDPLEPLNPQQAPLEPVEAVQPQHSDAEAAQAVPAPAESPVEPQAIEPSDPAAVTVAPAEEAAPVEPQDENAQSTAPVEPEAARPNEISPEETAEAVRPLPEPVPNAPAPTPRPQYTPPPPPPVSEPQPEPEPEPQASSGNGGQEQANQRRGAPEGRSAGAASTSSAASGQAPQAGNAAVSNYPGKIVTGLRRALRYPSAARRDELSGEVLVSFTVTANGGVGGISIARSSGFPILDQAAIETVQRAAPFPPIPPAAGRSSWQFSVPLAFTR